MKKEELIRSAVEAYEAGNPIMSDAEFDAIADENNVELGKGGKVKHAVPMLSQGKCHSCSEVEDFIYKAKSSLFTASLKIDGFACSLIYVDGELTLASTRGDGKAGEDITDAVKAYVCNIPLFIRDAPHIMEVRGEIYMPKSQDLTGIYTSLRNAAVGLCKRKEIDNSRPILLRFSLWDSVEPKFDNDISMLNNMAKLFDTVPYIALRGADEVAGVLASMCSIRKDFDGEADGVVFKVADSSEQSRMGCTAHHPKYSIAWKFPTKRTVTKVLGITLKTGATGKQTPVAKVTPVFLDGAWIRKVSIGSVDVMEAMGIAVGKDVVITRSGGVIPYIVGLARGDEEFD